MKKILLFVLSLTLLAAMFCTSASAGKYADKAAKLPDGTMIYNETFDYADANMTDTVLTTLGWTAQYLTNFTTESAPYADFTTQLEIESGRLKIINTVDSYAVVLDEEDMWEVGEHTYTVQFDVEMKSVGNTQRYIAVLTNYDGQVYYSFHLRCRGSANSQTHFFGQWSNIDGTGDGKANDTSDDGEPTVIKKFMGIDYSDSQNLIDKSVSVRIVVDRVNGYTISCRDNGAAEPKFVEVSKEEAVGTYTDGEYILTKNAICLKPGGTITAYLDNLMVWIGAVDEPTDKIVTYKAPAMPVIETTVPETTTPPVTTAKVTTAKPVTTTAPGAAVTTAAGTPSDTTKAPEPAKKDSCGKSGLIIGLAECILAAGACITFVTFKKKF